MPCLTAICIIVRIWAIQCLFCRIVILQTLSIVTINVCLKQHLVICIVTSSILYLR